MTLLDALQRFRFCLSSDPDAGDYEACSARIVEELLSIGERHRSFARDWIEDATQDIWANSLLTQDTDAWWERPEMDEQYARNYLSRMMLHLLLDRKQSEVRLVEEPEEQSGAVAAAPDGIDEWKALSILFNCIIPGIGDQMRRPSGSDFVRDFSENFVRLMGRDVLHEHAPHLAGLLGQPDEPFAEISNAMSARYARARNRARTGLELAVQEQVITPDQCDILLRVIANMDLRSVRRGL